MTDPYALPQTFILPRDLDFARLRRGMAAIGFAEIEIGIQAMPLIDGELEFFAWAWPGGVPQVNYRFDPVARLRLLDLAEAPPALRAVVAQHLRPMAPSALRPMLKSADDRERLFALYAARETERLDLIQDIGAMMESVQGALRDESEAVLHRLGDMAQARLEALTAARLVAQMATEEIDRMTLEEEVAELLVSPADCDDLFVPEIANRVAEALAGKRWPNRAVTAQPQSLDDVAAAPAGLFRGSGDINRLFPMGYRQIAGWLNPSRVWVAWQGHPPGGGQMLMDGLAFTGRSWVFFPKPFRIVLPLLPRFPQVDAVSTG